MKCSITQQEGSLSKAVLSCLHALLESEETVLRAPEGPLRAWQPQGPHQHRGSTAAQCHAAIAACCDLPAPHAAAGTTGMQLHRSSGIHGSAARAPAACTDRDAHPPVGLTSSRCMQLIVNGGNYGIAGGASGTGSAANQGSFGARSAEIYDPRQPVGQRYSGLLANSGLDRLYHSNAFLTINGDVLPARWLAALSAA